MSKLLENKQVIHIVSEIVAIVGITFYFSQQNRQLRKNMEDLAYRVQSLEDAIKKLVKQTQFPQHHNQPSPGYLRHMMMPRPQQQAPNGDAAAQELTPQSAPPQYQQPQPQHHVFHQMHPQHHAPPQMHPQQHEAQHMAQHMAQHEAQHEAQHMAQHREQPEQHFQPPPQMQPQREEANPLFGMAMNMVSTMLNPQQQQHCSSIEISEVDESTDNKIPDDPKAELDKELESELNQLREDDEDI